MAGPPLSVFAPGGRIDHLAVPTTLRELVVVFDELMRPGVGFNTHHIEDLREQGWARPGMTDCAHRDDDGMTLRMPRATLAPPRGPTPRMVSAIPAERSSP